MSNSNTPNEPPYPPYPPCTRSNCDCSNCLNFRAAAEAPARAPETATQCADREISEILAARRASNDESDRLRTFLKDCCCPCCEARARLRTISYDRAEHSSADIHCASSDRRDYNSDERLRDLVRDCVADCLAATYPRQRRDWFRETIDAAAKAIRPTATEFHETDTDAR